MSFDLDFRQFDTTKEDTHLGQGRLYMVHHSYQEHGCKLFQHQLNLLDLRPNFHSIHIV